jgi:hypothetical protein
MPRKVEQEIETSEQRVNREQLEAALKSKDPYEKLKKQVPARDVTPPAYKPSTPPPSGSGSGTPPASSDGAYKTIAQAMESSVDLTDMQYALSILIPKEDKINYGTLMVADISPEVFLPGMHMCAMDEIMCSDPRLPIDTNKIYMKYYTIWSVGLDREGRMDVADIAGAARAEKKLQSSLGLRGIGS